MTTTVTAVLLGAMAFTAAPSATAAPVSPAPSATVATASAARATPKLTVARSAKKYVHGVKGSRLTIRVRALGAKASGTIRVYDGKKHLSTKHLTSGKATYRLSKNLKAGKHHIRVAFSPSSSLAPSVHGTQRWVTVRVISQAKALRTAALKYVGIGYRWGGTSARTGFDCSGFTRTVYAKAHVARLSRSSSAQRRDGRVVSRKHARVGDLIWTPGHVAIYLGGNKMIDAPRPGKTIQVRSIWMSHPRFVHI